MKIATTPRTVRLQFDLPGEKVAEIDALMNTTGIATRKLLVEYALANFKWSIAQAIDGRAVVAYDANNNSYRELSMPPLDVAKGNGGVRTSVDNNGKTKGPHSPGHDSRKVRPSTIEGDVPVPA